MAKSIYQEEYRAAVRCLHDLRVAAGLSQLQLAEKLDRPQSFISNGETGYRRLDIYQLYTWVTACGSTLAKFGAMVDRRVGGMASSAKETRAPAEKTRKGRQR